MYRITKQISAESVEDIWLSLCTKLDFKEADVSFEGRNFTILSLRGKRYLSSFNICFAFVIIAAGCLLYVLRK